MKAIVAGIAAAAVALAIIIGGPYVYSRIKTPDDPNAAFLAACEDALKQRLKAPSTYRRIEDPLVTVDAISTDSAIAEKIPQPDNPDYAAVVRDFRALYDKLGAYRHRAFIRYESANSYGTPIAGVSTCDAIEAGEGAPDVGYGQVMIDGQTTLEWAASGVLDFGG